MISEHATEFLGHPITTYTGSHQGAPPLVCRLALDYDQFDKGQRLDQLLQKLVLEPFAAQLRHR